MAWWPAVLVLAVLGGALGLLVGEGSPSFRSEALLRVNGPQGEESSATPTAQEIAESYAVLTAAAGAVGVDPADLGPRASVSRQVDSNLLVIGVAADSPAQAESEAQALADAAIRQVRQMADAQLTGAMRAGANSLETGTLPDETAEQARREAIGEAIAAREDRAIESSLLLSAVGRVRPAVSTGLPPVGGLLAGLLSGAAAGVALALALGTGRAVIRSAGGARELPPDVESHGLEGVARVVTRCVGHRSPLIALVTLPGGVPEQDLVLSALLAELRVEGRRPLLVRSTDSSTEVAAGPTYRPGSPGLASGARREQALAQAGSDVMVLVGAAESWLLARLVGRADAVVLIGGIGATRVRDVEWARGELGDVPLSIVLP